MAYSETRIVIGGLAHIPVLIFIADFIKRKLGVKMEQAKENVVIEDKEKVIKELSNKLDNIKGKRDEVYEKVKKKDKKKKKKKDMKRD